MTKHFILAEDDEDDVLLFEEAIKLADVPIEVTIVLNCDSIMEKLLPDSLPELIILDTSLPGKSALECISAIREKYNAEQLPVVVLSTALSDLLKVKGYVAGFNLMIEKPIRFEEIKTLVRRLYSINWAANPVITPNDFYRIAI